MEVSRFYNTDTKNFELTIFKTADATRIGLDFC